MWNFFSHFLLLLQGKKTISQKCYFLKPYSKRQEEKHLTKNAVSWKPPKDYHTTKIQGLNMIRFFSPLILISNGVHLRELFLNIATQKRKNFLKDFDQFLHHNSVNHYNWLYLESFEYFEYELLIWLEVKAT